MRLLLAILFVVPAFGAAPAHAADHVGVPGDATLSLGSRHFVVHFRAADAARAPVVAAWAEDAYAKEVGWGYPAPAEDGDGKVDIYIDDIPPVVNAAGLAHDDNGTAPSRSGWIELDAKTGTTSEFVVAHELFHVVQFAMLTKSMGFATEATANWAAALVGGATTASRWADRDSLDCVGLACHDQGGYNRWGFFKFLSDRYGVLIVRDMWMQPTNDAVAALDAVLADRGTSVVREFVTFESSALDTYSPQRPFLSPKVGVDATMRFNLARLSSTVATVDEGLASDGELCRAGTLHVKATTSDSNAALAYHVWPNGTTIPVAQGTSFDVPNWRTCLAGSVTVQIVSGLRGGFADVTASFTPADEPVPAVQVMPWSKPTARNTGMNLSFRSSGFGAVDVTLIGYAATTRYEVFGDRMERWFTFGRQLKAGRYVLLVTPVSTAGTVGTPTRVLFVVARA